MPHAGLYNFDERAGGKSWRDAVRAQEEARQIYLQTVANPPPSPERIARPDGRVVDLAAWREAVASECDPVTVAAEAYRVASLRLLMIWAPNSSELREQMRLAAELAGLCDPLRASFDAERDPAKVDATPAEILRLLFNSSLGLVQGERDAANRSAAR